MEDRYYSTKEAAELLQVHDVTILRMIRSGRITAVNVAQGKRPSYRISQVALNEFLKAATYEPGS